ncbi:MAG: hypothetical protein ACTSQJ_07000 [Promethearchaeota archaeon]
MTDKVDIQDIEAFIEGLKTSIDSLEGIDITKSKGFQAQLAKTISMLRIKKIAKIEKQPLIIGKMSKEDLKNFLINQLEFLKRTLDSSEKYESKKFNLIMNIVKLREKISSL